MPDSQRLNFYKLTTKRSAQTQLWILFLTVRIPESAFGVLGIMDCDYSHVPSCSVWDRTISHYFIILFLVVAHLQNRTGPFYIKTYTSRRLIVKKTNMQSNAATPQEYINTLPEDRRKVMTELRKVILKNLPSGFSEVMQPMPPGSRFWI